MVTDAHCIFSEKENHEGRIVYFLTLCGKINRRVYYPSKPLSALCLICRKMYLTRACGSPA